MANPQIPAAKSLAARWFIDHVICGMVPCLAGALAATLPGREISSDVCEYEIYLGDPTILLRKVEDPQLYGGRVAAPLLPFGLALPTKIWLGMGFKSAVALALDNDRLGSTWSAIGLACSVGDLGCPEIS